MVRPSNQNPNWRGGKSSHPLYHTYNQMLSRCFQGETHPRWSAYGGRGITVCDRWRTDFWSFVTDMGPRPTGFWLDRLDNDGNYEPSNCAWVDPSTSNKNRRPTTHSGLVRDEKGQYRARG